MSKTRSTKKADATKAKILLIAERLFAQKGIEAVSLREIASAASHGNNTAVQYHFGSKQGLAQAISEFRVAQMEPLRRELLEEGERSGVLGDPLFLLEAQYLPHLALVNEEGKHPFAAFMVQYVTRFRMAGISHAVDVWSERSATLRRIMQLLDEHISYIPAPQRAARMSHCGLIFFANLVRLDAAGERDPRAFAIAIADTLTTMASALCAPSRQRPKHLAQLTQDYTAKFLTGDAKGRP